MSRQKKTKGKGSLEASDSSSEEEEEEEEETKDSSGDQEMAGPDYDTAESFKSPKNVERLFTAIAEKAFVLPDFPEPLVLAKEPLSSKWLEEYWEKGSEFSKTPIIWSNRLKTCGGYTRGAWKNHERVIEVIKLSHRITEPFELRCVLAHEMCHAATWNYRGTMDHGPDFEHFAANCEEKTGIHVPKTCCLIPPPENRFRCSGCGKERQSHRSVPPRPHYCAPGATWKLVMKQYKGFAFGSAE